MTPWILLASGVLVLGAVSGCSGPSEDEAVAPSSIRESHESVQAVPVVESEPAPTPVPPPIRMTVEEIAERFTGAEAAGLVAEFGPPLGREDVPFQDRLEAWRYRAKLEHRGHRVDRIDLVMRYGDSIVAYGFPELIPGDRRALVMPESDLSAAVSGRDLDAILRTMGEPDWVHLRQDGTTAWEYCVWIQRDTTQFPGVVVFPGPDGVVNSYSFNLNGTREVQ
jgi:hypothetical protein